jgi:hypothetical protein
MASLAKFEIAIMGQATILTISINHESEMFNEMFGFAVS